MFMGPYLFQDHIGIILTVHNKQSVTQIMFKSKGALLDFPSIHDHSMSAKKHFSSDNFPPVVYNIFCVLVHFTSGCQPCFSTAILALSTKASPLCLLTTVFFGFWWQNPVRSLSTQLKITSDIAAQKWGILHYPVLYQYPLQRFYYILHWRISQSCSYLMYQIFQRYQKHFSRIWPYI